MNFDKFIKTIGVMSFFKMNSCSSPVMMFLTTREAFILWWIMATLQMLDNIVFPAKVFITARTFEGWRCMEEFMALKFVYVEEIFVAYVTVDPSLR